MTTSEEIKAEYTSSLADLTCNSKPLINVLTMLAEENIQNAAVIVDAIETHLSKVKTEVKLPILYLIDCIVKNVQRTYKELFSHNIVSTFCSVFKVVDEKTRAEMFRLRQTWNDVFPQKKLYAIDVQIKLLDPAWPVTAVPPSNSIHFNPKFLANTTSGSNNTPKPKTETPQVNITPASMDTLKMHEKLIQKQKELLELKQKKLELEVLQTQVQLQEQIKNNPSSARPNILLKPEVAKQMVATAPVSTSLEKNPTMNAVLNQRLMSQGNAPRISPASSALVSAVSKPIRDPRLLKQQKPSNNINSTVQLGSKSSVLDANKVVTNKKSVRDGSSRNEARLMNNKDDVPVPKGDTAKSKTFTKSRQTDTHKSSSSSSSFSSKSSSRSAKNSANSSEAESKSNTSSTKSNSSTSLDSPVKSKSDKSSKSPSSKHKKRESSKSDEKKSGSGKESSKRDKSSYKSESSSPSSFKGVKNLSKTRNYIRRNLSPMSPDPPQDEDLRPFIATDKQVRLLNDTTDDKRSTGADIDLRQLPTVIGKKRPSTESLEPNVAKKSKSEFLDVLFGHEDVDLRQLPAVNNDRPPTPPPPIISSRGNVIDLSDQPKKSNNLDAIRAKLANATGVVLSKSFNKKRMNSGATGEQERKSHSNMSGSIVISPDEEQGIKQGTLSNEESTHLLNKIITQVEKSKLRQAKEKEHEQSFGNISLQPISDDELEGDYSDEEKNGRQSYDKDDRFGSSHEGKYGRRGVAGGNGNWRGGRRRVWDTTPIPLGPTSRAQQGSLRPHSKAWLQQQKGWRQMPSPFGQQQQQSQHSTHSGGSELNVNEEEGGKSPDISSEIVVDSVNQDDIKTINIDAIPRDIRYYDDIAVIFMSWDDPREISFQDGARRVTFNETDTYILNFNEPEKEVLINGVTCKVRLGAPSREIYINGAPYECFFNGPSITIELNGSNTTVQLDGPAPQVKIGTDKRTDLVAGKVNLIVNAKTIVPIYLDAKVQKFVVDGETVTLKFVDALKTVLINDVPFNVEFGGLPKPITIHNKKHFVRFSVLPRGVKPGYVNIKDMGGCCGGDGGKEIALSPSRYNENSQDSSQYSSLFETGNEPALPSVFGGKTRRATAAGGDESPERNSNSPHFFQSLLQQQNLNHLDVLSNVMASSVNSASCTSGYQVENVGEKKDGVASNQNEVAPVPSLPQLPASNINVLFQQLVATGIITTSNKDNAKATVAISSTAGRHSERQSEIAAAAAAAAKVVPKRNPLECLKPITFSKPESLKVRQMALYSLLYSGMQCSSCGMRFPPEQSMHYSQHLDWHFRQNRKGKKNIRVAASRRWYYSISDWKNYEEIEDLEEREKNYFDQQLIQAENNGEEAEEEVEIPSVPADSDITDSRCEVCQDAFDQFFNEEKEEWHLRNAIRIDDKTYHPVCYDDYQLSLQDQSADDSKMEVEQEETRPDVIPGLEIILDDDDDESEKDKNEEKSEAEEVLIEESDESKAVSEEPKENTNEAEEEEDEGDDDDVILNEVAPIKIVVDDDDDYPETHEHFDVPKFKSEKMDTSEMDDGFVDVSEGLFSLKNGGQIKIKAEPVDPDEMPMEAEPFEEETEKRMDEEEEEEEAKDQFVEAPTIQPVHNTGLVSSIDGNVEMEGGAQTTATGIGGKIKINISKPLPVIASKENKDNTPNDNVDDQHQSHIEPLLDPSQPLPPGEEPVQLNLKPALKGVNLKKMPPLNRGTELSGLCSIM